MSDHFSASPMDSAGGIAWQDQSSSSVDAEGLVFRVDLFIVGIICILVLLRLPRALARFKTTSEWGNGHVFRHVAYQQRRPARPVRSASHRSQRSAAKAHAPSTPPATDESHTLYSHANHAQRVNEKGAPIAVSYPPHVSSCFRIFRPLLVRLRRRLSPGVSIAQALILLIYLCILLYPSTYMSSPFTDALRTGFVAIAQVPFVYAYGTKNNVLGALLGVGYEKVARNHTQGMISTNTSVS